MGLLEECKKGCDGPPWLLKSPKSIVLLAKENLILDINLNNDSLDFY